METIEERAIAAFNAINGREYRCALAESQVSEQLYEQVKKEYSIAQNAFVQGVIYQRKIDVEKACSLAAELFSNPHIKNFDKALEDFRKSMEG